MAVAKKLFVTVWEPLLEGINGHADALCLRRDAFLERLLSREVRMLDQEVDVPNSPVSRLHLQKSLEHLPRKALTLALSDDTRTRISSVCEKKAIPRDCFINRVLFLLVAKHQLFDAAMDFGVKHDFASIREQVRETYLERPAAPVRAEIPKEFLIDAGEVLTNPFAFLRLCITHAQEKGIRIPALHKITIPDQLGQVKGLHGMNCYIEEVEVPGTSAWKEMRESVRELLDSI